MISGAYFSIEFLLVDTFDSKMAGVNSLFDNGQFQAEMFEIIWKASYDSKIVA